MIERADYEAEIQKMVKLCLQKNSDYANSEDFLKNFKRSKNFGLNPFIGVLIRMEDKMSRIENIVKSGQTNVDDEKLEDSLRDLANYAIIAVLCLMEEQDHAS